ncbi:hypothetical protein DUI87_32126 [Hirundo rustica rustica]|uniref:Uncharacterized protein n=1 Tax=Hirundo rustica rustica TaxID=333673 RepID=A0A3M0IRI0_HIRRU|nr:hypothetical protein DUI87_32126 [Hirundo rustica rustica]
MSQQAGGVRGYSIAKRAMLKKPRQLDRAGPAPAEQAKELIIPGYEQMMNNFWGIVHGIWSRLKRDRRQDGRSPFRPPGLLAKREQPGTGNEEECWRASIPVVGKGDVRVGV